MVLKFASAALALLGTSTILACVPKVAPLQSSTTQAVTVFGVVDTPAGRQVDPLPDALMQSISEALGARNLTASWPSSDVYLGKFQLLRSSEERIKLTGALRGEAPLALLIETKPAFYSQLNGRYRWEVSVKIRLQSNESNAAPVEANFSVPTFLDFDHQRELDAVQGALPHIAARVARMLDDFLAPTARPVQTPPESLKGSGAALSPSDLIYFVMVDRFENGDRSNDADANPKNPHAFHGGDIAGVRARLAELQSLGVSWVWLSPVFKTRTESFFGHGAYHGYWVDDLASMDPRFGTIDELAGLSNELHQRGMKLMLDMVLNHVAFDAPLTREHPEWFHTIGSIQDYNDPAQVQNANVHGLPDLAQEREDVYAYLLKQSTSWIERVKPDGFRLDAVRHIPSTFWARYNSDIRSFAGSNFVLLGEDLEGDPRKLALTLRGGRFSTLFDFPLHFAFTESFCGDAPMGRLATLLDSERDFPEAHSLVTLLDNHDLARIVTACDGSVSRTKAAIDFLFSVRGVPSLTYGTELPLAGEQAPENRADMRFSKGTLASAISAASARRRADGALLHGATTILALSDDILVFARTRDERSTLVAMNKSAKTKTIAVHGYGEWVIEPGAVELSTRAHSSAQPITAAHSTQEMVEVVFEAHVDGLKDAPDIRLVGSLPEVGMWQVENALRGTRAKSGAWTFSARLPVGRVLAYKLIRVSATGVDWQPGHDHYLLVTESARPASLRWQA